MTPTSTSEHSRIRSRRRRADASGSSGSRISVSGPFAFDWSTPADAQTNPWRVSAMMSVGGLERTIRRLSWRITSMRRASSAPASSRARSEGTTSSRRKYATFDLRDRLLRDDDDVAAREPSCPLRRFDDQRTEIVPLLELRNPA